MIRTTLIKHVSSTQSLEDFDPQATQSPSPCTTSPTDNSTSTVTSTPSPFLSDSNFSDDEDSGSDASSDDLHSLYDGFDFNLDKATEASSIIKAVDISTFKKPPIHVITTSIHTMDDLYYRTPKVGSRYGHLVHGPKSPSNT